MLGTLFERILAEVVFSLGKATVHVFEFSACVLDLVLKLLIVAFVLFVVVTLLGVKIIKFGFVRVLNLLDLLFIGLDLIFHITLFSKEAVEMRLLLVVLILDVHVESLNIFGLGVGAMLIECQIVIGEFAFIATNILDQVLVFALERQIG